MRCSILAGDAKAEAAAYRRGTERFADVARLLRARDDGLRIQALPRCPPKQGPKRRTPRPTSSCRLDHERRVSIGDHDPFVGGSHPTRPERLEPRPPATIITGPHTFNFTDVVRVSRATRCQLPERRMSYSRRPFCKSQTPEETRNAADLPHPGPLEASRGATANTVELQHF